MLPSVFPKTLLFIETIVEVINAPNQSLPSHILVNYNYNQGKVLEAQKGSTLEYESEFKQVQVWENSFVSILTEYS